MHGGATATIFDFATSMPLTLVAKDDFWFMPGVSRTLNVTYLEAVPNGQEVEIEAEAVKIGKNLGESPPKKSVKTKRRNRRSCDIEAKEDETVLTYHSSYQRHNASSKRW